MDERKAVAFQTLAENPDFFFLYGVDGWVDAKGMFMAAAAGPVYKLLGKKDMGTAEFPPVGTPLIDGDIAFRQHNGGHTSGPNWPTFLTFAQRYLKAPAAKL